MQRRRAGTHCPDSRLEPRIHFRSNACPHPAVGLKSAAAASAKKKSHNCASAWPPLKLTPTVPVLPRSCISSRLHHPASRSRSSHFEGWTDLISEAIQTGCCVFRFSLNKNSATLSADRPDPFVSGRGGSWARSSCAEPQATISRPRVDAQARAGLRRGSRRRLP